MMQHEIRPPAGSRHSRKRVGRGESSGHGKTSGRGQKGQKARAGGNIPAWFEGGQLPLVKRLPFLRGFVNIFKTEYSLVKIKDLERLEAGSEVNLDVLVHNGMVRSVHLPVKILGDGVLTKALTVEANKFSASAREKIETAGGRVVEIPDARSNP
ncbi:MAG: 50S ribosomal protein L15 [Dehalococcoidia bacterium]|nr:50S ribosomal protein L15 [Dehalococcoidia bacterium]